MRECKRYQINSELAARKVPIYEEKISNIKPWNNWNWKADS